MFEDAGLMSHHNRKQSEDMYRTVDVMQILAFLSFDSGSVMNNLMLV